MADKQTVLKFIRFFISRNTYIKLEFYDSLILTETYLRASTFSKIFRGYTPRPLFTAGRGNEGG
jgi:hypothetical protein